MPTNHITSLWLICCITSKYYIIYVHYNAIYSFIHICRALHLFFHLYLQSSALGFLLAQKHFTNPLVAVPSAVSVVCMAVSVFLPLAQTYYFEYFHSLHGGIAFYEFTVDNLIDSNILLYSLVAVVLQSFGGTVQYLLMTRMTSRNEKSWAIFLSFIFL